MAQPQTVIQPEAQHDDHATRVWVALQAFVRAQDRREELRETLCLGRGTGRVTALMKLTEGPLTLRDIAELIGVDAPYATLIVDHLEARGLVERTLHPGDRRRKLVTLTLAGREAAALASHIMDQPPAGFTQLTDDELAVLEKILNRLGSVLDPGEIAAAANAVDAVLANPGARGRMPGTGGRLAPRTLAHAPHLPAPAGPLVSRGHPGRAARD